MSDLVARADVLPHNATRRELAIADADAAILDHDTDAVRRIGGPDIDAVPAAYLPQRAWARSTDVWDPLWPEAVKRAVIKAAPVVQAYKGTVYAVETALAALNIGAVVTEWWQTTPRGLPYTFSVRCYVQSRLYDGALLDPRTVKAAFGAVMRAKPASRAFDLTLSIGLAAPLGLAPVIVPRCRIRLAAVPVLPPGETF